MRTLAAAAMMLGMALLVIVSLVNVPDLVLAFGGPPLNEGRIVAGILVVMSAIGAVAWILRKR